MASSGYTDSRTNLVGSADGTRGMVWCFSCACCRTACNSDSAKNATRGEGYKKLVIRSPATSRRHRAMASYRLLWCGSFREFTAMTAVVAVAVVGAVQLLVAG